MGRLDSIKGKMGPRVKLLLYLLLPIGAFGVLLFIMHRVERPPTYLEMVLLAILTIYASGVIGWLFSQKIPHERARRAAIRAVRLIEKTEEDATELLNQTLRETGRVADDLGDNEQAKSLILHRFELIQRLLETLHRSIAASKDDWDEFLPEEFAKERQLRKKKTEVRLERDASAAQLEEMLAVETSKSEEVRELADKLENLEDRLGNIEATPSPITGAPREAPVRDAYYWFSRGLRYSARGQYEEAIDAYNKAIQLKEDLSEAWYNKGVALAGLKRYEEAIKCYDKALKLRKDLPEAWNNKGAALDDLGRYEEAIECYDKALKLRENYPGALNNKGNALADLGRVEKKPELFQEAIECFDKALELRKDYPSAWFNKACGFALLKEKDKMLEALQEAIRLDAEYKDKAKKDEDFKAYWEDEDFKAVVK